jgi:hypothetical protein
MSFIVKDRIKETTTTTGTGTVTLAGASSGFRSFADIGNGNETYYAIVGGTEWEVGIGTYTSSGTVLSRTTVLSNSLGTTALINFSAGTKDVFCTYPSSAATITVSTTPPTAPVNGTLWWSSDEGKLKIYYVDANSSQWVDALTASTGSFAVDTDLHSPSAIGDITPNTINATTSTANSFIPNLSTIPTNGLYLPSANSVGIATNSTNAIVIDANQNVGIGLTPDNTAFLQIASGTTAKAPLEFTAGTNMTTPDAGSMEYDGTMPYFTSNNTSGRGYIPSVQVFGLSANGTAFGAAIGNFFGANSAINLVGGAEYEVEAYCYFTKTTAGTVTVTATTSLAPAILNGTVDYGAATGGTATGAANRISLFASTSANAAFGASASLTTAVNHCFRIRLVLSSNASPSNIRINFTSSAGTVTPLRESYYKVTRLPPANVGSFAA